VSTQLATRVTIVLHMRNTSARISLAVVLLCVAFCVPYALQLSSRESKNFAKTVPGTDSARAEQILREHFPELVEHDTELLYLTRSNGPIVSDNTADVHDRLVKLLQDPVVTSVTSYYTLMAAHANKHMAEQYINPNSESLLITMSCSQRDNLGPLDAFLTTLHSEVSALDLPAGFGVALTGPRTMALASAKVIGKDIGMVDGIGLPFIAILFAVMVGSWRLTLLPFVNVGICLMVSYAACDALLASFTSLLLTEYVPKVGLFLCLALSIDYSFFLLSRFQESRTDDRAASMDAHVAAMIRGAGHVLVVSGVVLLLSWSALAAFPAFGTDTLGYVAAITVAVCIVINLVVTPLTLLSFPAFFGRASLRLGCCRASQAGAEPAGEPGTKLNAYGRFAALISRAPGKFIAPIFVYAVMVPALFALPGAGLTLGVQGKKATGDAAAAYAAARSDFGAVLNAPFVIALETVDGSPLVQSADFFAAACRLADGADARGLATQTAARLYPGAPCLTPAAASAAVKASKDYRYVWTELTDAGTLHRTAPEKATATVVLAFSKAETFSPENEGTVRALKDELAVVPASLNAALLHPMAVELDAKELTVRRLPYAITFTILAIMGLLAARFRSAFLPVKLLLTMVVPIAFTEAVAVLVFQHGILSWTHIPALAQSEGGILWITPVAITFMLIGFALDYELFLFSRVYELHQEGASDSDAIVEAVNSTGPVISTAGIIMCLAFGGMVVQSQQEFLCQMGFSMIFGILVDTFVVRTALVPAIIGIGGTLNWWPGEALKVRPTALLAGEGAA
jgi:RND superfamily putative drug exporter